MPYWKTIASRRKEVFDAARRGAISGLFRDAQTLEFPNGDNRRSRAIYFGDGQTVRVVVDEHGAPTKEGRVLFCSATSSKHESTALYRLVNKNQLEIRGGSLVQLSPKSWTEKHPILSNIYETVQDAKFTAGIPIRDGASVVGSQYLSTIVQRSIDLADLRHVRTLGSNVYEQLPELLQHAMVILDSDLGSQREPLFVVKQIHHPKQLNFVSPWRCYVPEHCLDNLLNTFLPPAIFSGLDIYGRPIAGETPSERLNQFAVVCRTQTPEDGEHIEAVDYQAVAEFLRETMDRALDKSDVWMEFAGDVPRSSVCDNINSILEFLFPYYSSVYEEHVIYGDHKINSVNDLEFDGNDGNCIGKFRLGNKPIWTHGQKITDKMLLSHWYTPRFCL